MSKYLKATLASALVLSAAPVWAEGFGLGREALPEEIAAWDLEIRPDGTGLPVGSGSVADGDELYQQNCAVCHGVFAEGVDNWPELAGGEDTLADEDPVKTVGSYWPYLSTVYDYVHRSMPYGNAQTLSHDDVYAITAYILYSNYLVEDDFVLSNENFLEVEMPNAGGFIIDNREEVEAHFWGAEPCMSDCKEAVEVTMRARVLDVTPEDETEDAAVTEASATEAAATEETAVVEAAVDAELVAAGEKVFRTCKACHQVGDGAKNRAGPVLNGIVGKPAGAVEGFKYSKALMAMAEDGLVWDEENLTAFLAKPRDFMKGTRMAYAGIRKDEDLEAIIAYLSTFEE